MRALCVIPVSKTILVTGYFQLDMSFNSLFAVAVPHTSTEQTESFYHGVLNAFQSS